MMQKRTIVIVAIFAVLMLGAVCGLGGCGGGGENGGEQPATPSDSQTVAEALTSLEASGELPTLDRSSSIASPDANINGVRDDIESYIDSLPDTAAQKASLRQLSRAISEAMLLGVGSPDDAELRAASNTIGRAVNCIWAVYDPDTGIAKNAKVADIRKITANTPERFNAYAQYNEMLDGKVFRLPKGDTCETLYGFSVLVSPGSEGTKFETVSMQESQSPPKGLAQGGEPLSEVETVTMPPVDIPAENEPSRKDEPRRFAKTIEVELTPNTSGTWETLEGDMRLWRLRIVSPGALSLNLGFTRYFMPPGGRLFLYTPDYKTVVGPFTEKNNHEHRQLWTPLLLDDEVVIEITLPADRLSMLELKLTAVNHGYRW